MVSEVNDCSAHDTHVKLRLMKEHHDVPWAGHRGVAKTIELIRRQFWWPSLRADVKEYVNTCVVCQ